MRNRLPAFLTLILLLLAASGLQAQRPAKSKILWLTLEQAQEKSVQEDRKILLFLYTDWCGWCKKMETVTLNETEIADYINRNFIPVRFNAEQRQTVQLNDRSYAYVDLKPKGVNELAIELMGGRISYPTIAFLDENWKLIQSIPSYHPPAKFEQIITYFGGNYYRRIPWSSYQKTYEPLNGEK